MTHNKIQPYSIHDFTRICEIYNASKLDELSFETAKFILIPLERDSQRLPAFQECETFVYHHLGKIAGYIAVYSEKEISEIRGLFVHPDFRGLGIAKRLLAHIITNNKIFTLQVVASNRAALTLYKKLDFKVSVKILGGYNGEPVEVFKMCLEVNYHSAEGQI